MKACGWREVGDEYDSRRREPPGALAVLLPAGFRSGVRALLPDGGARGVSHEEYLLALSQLEAAERTERRVARLMSESRLPREKTLATFDTERLPAVSRTQLASLQDGGFLDRAVNVIALGNPGTGETHLLCALGSELVRQGRPVSSRRRSRLSRGCSPQSGTCGSPPSSSGWTGGCPDFCVSGKGGRSVTREREGQDGDPGRGFEGAAGGVQEA